MCSLNVSVGAADGCMCNDVDVAMMLMLLMLLLLDVFDDFMKCLSGCCLPVSQMLNACCGVRACLLSYFPSKV